MVSAYRSKLIVEADGGLPYTLFAPLVYDSAHLNRTVIVPTGFRTDLASIPRVLWSILPPFGSYSDAAVVHDFLYQFNGIDRHDADQVLNEAMEVCQVGRWKRWTIYSGVVLGGWVTWRRYRKEEASQV